MARSIFLPELDDVVVNVDAGLVVVPPGAAVLGVVVPPGAAVVVVGVVVGHVLGKTQLLDAQRQIFKK